MLVVLQYVCEGKAKNGLVILLLVVAVDIIIILLSLLNEILSDSIPSLVAASIFLRKVRI